MIPALERLARAYITLRDSGETGEARGLAHDALMDDLREAGVVFGDREHAARIARAIVTLAEVGSWPPPHHGVVKRAKKGLFPDRPIEQNRTCVRYSCVTMPRKF